MKNLPTLLLISGSTGSGKSTLSKKIVDSLGLFHVNRDRIKFGVEHTLKSKPEERVAVVIPRYFDALEALLELDISLIADGTHFPGATEGQLERFSTKAKILNIHCNATNSITRKEKWRKDLAVRVEEKGETRVEYEPDYFPSLKPKNQDPSAKPINHNWPILEVDTSDGYYPAFDDILEWVREQEMK